MFGRLQDKIDHALARVRQAQPLTHIEVQTCLRDLRMVLLQIEVGATDIDAAFDAMLAKIANSEAMLAPDAGVRVEILLRRALLSHPVVGSALKSLRDGGVQMPTASTKETRWDFKELDNHLANKQSQSTAFRFVRPAAERRPAKNIDLRHRSPFVDGVSQQQTDSRDRNLDRATVDRFLRDLGKGSPDFGPEPPTGGQPARI